MVVKMSSPGALVENRLNGLGVSMNVELISVLIAVLAIGATLAGLILTGNRGLRQDMARLGWSYQDCAEAGLSVTAAAR